MGVSFFLGVALALRTWPAWGAYCWDVVSGHPFLVAAGGLAVVTGLVGFTNSALGRRLVDLAKLRVPLVGSVVSKLVLVRCVRRLGLLLSSGVPVLAALTTVQETAGNVLVGEAFKGWKEVVKDGESLLTLLEGVVLLPNTVSCRMDQWDGQSFLEKELLRIADELQDEVEDHLATVRHILSPIFVVVLIALIACLVTVLAGFAR